MRNRLFLIPLTFALTTCALSAAAEDAEAVGRFGCEETAEASSEEVVRQHKIGGHSQPLLSLQELKRWGADRDVGHDRLRRAVA